MGGATDSVVASRGFAQDAESRERRLVDKRKKLAERAPSRKLARLSFNEDDEDFERDDFPLSFGSG